MTNFCDELKRERLKRHLTQEEMSNLLGLKRSTYSLYESGKRIPKIETLDQIAEALDCFIYYDYETHQHRLIAYEDGQTIRSIRTYADPDPENTRKKFQERSKNESRKIDYDQSYSYASSEEEYDGLQKEHQIESAEEERSNIHKYDASIRIRPTHEQVKKFLENSEAEELLKRQASGQKLTDEEYRKVSNYIEQTKEIYSEIRFKINNIFDSLNRISKRCLELENIQRQENIRILDKHLREIKSMMADQPDNQENLNDIGRQKVNDYIADLSNIPEYQKNNDPPQE